MAKLGAQHVFDHSNPSYIDEIKALVGANGIDVIVENAANVNLANDLKVCRHHGYAILTF